MDSSLPGLSPIQSEFLQRWFALSSDFFLTGGAALVVALEIPRTTKDLDLFTASPEAFEGGDSLVHSVANSIQAETVALRTAPLFRRYRISRGSEATLVDLVSEPVAPVNPAKLRKNGLIMDPPEEILVNKICAIVGRGEGRDFVDAYFLSQLGLDIEKALVDANLKDGGVDASSLLYVLSDTHWGKFRVPGVDPELVAATGRFFANWSEKLGCGLFPHHPGVR